MADANETVEATLERANWLFSSGLGGTLGILKEADADLSKRLHGLVKKQGAKDLKFTEAQALAYRQQIRLTQKYMDERLLGHTHAQALKAIGAGTKSTVRLMKKLEKQFTGIAKPLQLDSQAMQDSIVRGTGASLLRQHQTSVGRYSTAMIQDFERVMRVGALEGLSQHQVISRLVAQGELGGINAAALHAKEPGYFPAPSGYVVRRYWAERIVRTETAYALNAANASTIATAKVTDFPDMQKKILAHFDTRTAPDSIAVHGQIRPVDGLFTDGAGRMYKHPPARPNDREVVIPWRPHWGELPATKQAPPEAQAAAKVEAQPAGLAPASSGQILVPSSNVKAMVAKLKAQHGEQGQDQVLAQKFQQALEAAQLAKVKGTQAMGAAKLASEKSLARAQALQQVKAAKTPKSLAELKAKADAYKAEVQAKAAAKVAELEAARAAKLKAVASTKLTALGQAVPSLTDPGPDLVKLIKQTQQTKPELWAEMKKQLGVGGVAPHTVSVAMAKKIAPGADFSAFTKKSKKPEPPLAPPAPKLPPLEFKTVSGYIDIHDATTGAKLAYMKPGPTPGSVMVSPPAHLTGFTAKTFATPEEGAPYALQVSAALQLAKAEAAVKAAAAQAAADVAAKEKAAAAKAQAIADRSKPVKMRWSDKWKEPARPIVPFTNQAGAVDKGLAKPSRSGVSVAADSDFLEDFLINFTTEIRQGVKETVARFRVNEHRSGDMLSGMAKFQAKKDNFPGYPKLKGLDNPQLEFASTHGELQGKAPGVDMYQTGVHFSTVRYFHSTDASSHPALKNLVEVRFEEPQGDGKRWAKVKGVMKALGIDPDPPKPEAFETYKQAKVLSVADKLGALQLGQLKERTPEAVAKVWADAVKRDPKLKEIADDAKLREVAPGHYALYSKKLADRYRATGVTHLTHNVSGSDDVLALMLANEEAGLLSSRERFQRGLVFRGMSTDTDFSTGGADSVFTRLAKGPGATSGSGKVEIDASELGRFDVYAFNHDAYGKAGTTNSGQRMRLSDLDHMGAESLSSSNETMLRRAVAPAVIRKVFISGNKTAFIKKLKDQGVTEYGGVPLEELIE